MIGVSLNETSKGGNGYGQSRNARLFCRPVWRACDDRTDANNTDFSFHFRVRIGHRRDDVMACRQPSDWLKKVRTHDQKP